MFYSETILARKGPLARVWLAAHWERKLSKQQFLQTNLRSTVRAITGSEQPLALRLSGQLLLGVVRIYSRKCRYLLEDCNEILQKLKLAFRSDGQLNLDISGELFVAGASREASSTAKAAITLPNRATEFDLFLPMPDIAGMTLADARKRTAAMTTPTLAARQEDITLPPSRRNAYDPFYDFNTPLSRSSSFFDTEDKIAAAGGEDEPLLRFDLGDDIFGMSRHGDMSIEVGRNMTPRAASRISLGLGGFGPKDATPVPLTPRGVNASGMLGGQSQLGDDGFGFGGQDEYGFGGPDDTLGLGGEPLPISLDESLSGLRIPGDVGDVTGLPVNDDEGDLENGTRQRRAPKLRTFVDRIIEMPADQIQRQQRNRDDILIPIDQRHRLTDTVATGSSLSMQDMLQLAWSASIAPITADLFKAEVFEQTPAIGNASMHKRGNEDASDMEIEHARKHSRIEAADISAFESVFGPTGHEEHNTSLAGSILGGLDQSFQPDDGQYGFGGLDEFGFGGPDDMPNQPEPYAPGTPTSRSGLLEDGDISGTKSRRGRQQKGLFDDNSQTSSQALLTTTQQHRFDPLGLESEVANADADSGVNRYTGVSTNTVRAVELIREHVGNSAGAFSFEELVPKATSHKADVSRMFFELLVLGTRGALDLKQNEAFSSIGVQTKDRLFTLNTATVQ